MPDLTYASLCTGVGGFDLGFDAAGFRCVLQSEQDADCRAVLARHWPDVPRTDDVNDDETERLIRDARPDAVCFGFPCQDLSVAGRRAGLAGKRSGLFFRCLDLAADSGAAWVCIENVVGLLSSNGGRDMGTVLGSLDDRGYRWAYRVLDLQHFGAPQRRRRVFIVGHLGEGADPASVLFESEGGDGCPASGEEAGADAAERANGGVAGCLNFGSGDRGFRTEPGEHLVPVNEIGKKINGGSGRSGCGIGRPGDPAFTLGTDGRQGVGPVVYQCHGGSVGPLGTLRRGNGSMTGGVPFVTGNLTHCHKVAPTLNTHLGDKQGLEEQHIRGGCGHWVAFDSPQPTTAVRRLIPMECERLMGWPDGHTERRADGTEVSDTARYRMCGNGVGSPVAEWLARRLRRAHERSVTRA